MCTSLISIILVHKFIKLTINLDYIKITTFYLYFYKQIKNQQIKLVQKYTLMQLKLLHKLLYK